MRKLVLLGAAFALSVGAQAQTFTYTGAAVPIPDAPAGSGCGVAGQAATVQINVPSSGIIADVDVRLNITHTWVGDVTATLTHGATTVTIAERPGGTTPTSCGNSADNMITWADDEGTDGSIENGPFPYIATGRYTPNAPLSAFDGQDMAGIWTLTLTDNGAGDLGTLTDYALEFDIVPVELTSFTGTADGTSAELRWTTASETNNAGFEVQTLRGAEWVGLGFVEGHGTTTEAQQYAYRANGLNAGTHVFRLRQVDFDGAVNYHGDVEVGIGVPGTHALSAAYPNPFNPQTSFTLAVAQTQHVAVEVFNSLGQRVAVAFDGEVAADQTQQVQIDGSALASGLYVVRVTGATFQDALRVSLVK